MKLLIFGLGYSASYIAQHLQGAGIEVTATVRTTAKAEELGRRGIAARVFSSSYVDPLIADDIKSSDAILSSVPPTESGDPVLGSFACAITSESKSRWIGYLSTIGVYGDHLGNWVDETTPATSEKPRSQLRIAAEQRWLVLGAHVFRLSGIYGPGRNQLEKLAAGTATRIIKPGQVFNRIHVADIAAVVAASLSRPLPGAIYNVTDNEPAPPQQVVEFAAELCGRTPPPEIAFEHAELSAMARSFYLENCRVRNDLIRTELGVTLAYPSYREGLSALRALGEGPA
ncbi:nucleoside-diphosphate-sugar epimerase [Rhodopseudomonas thermotolerans]|uniref:Nucleoside-diphosphate-sugar epimerase n=2 Tax=Rhodopseudomonas TaxID=1073 RepID=A0A336JV73_9BRAD|nr:MULTISPECIES: SDR family oxidoreductase [Rhodopseudomonas]RED32679.1 nucleoside-diphosphate-sugar epimerase [Rhodopseudomonas pentothenatexigens]REF93688.1 nucleoside-diphosphate-sugar epimerase [Rhodopseudomonas thermotolerans]SSW91574.1 nucleoside-diphosphate-sugar epimerase [Rhodopseudomonas pentothenatexigens]